MTHVLRATQRCLVEDLGLPDTAAHEKLENLAGAHRIVDAFLDKRARDPHGQETIQGLTSRLVAYSLHSGDYRGITWHQEKAAIVWLLAAGFHRSGKPDDAYAHFLRLDQTGRLLPTPEDVQFHVALQTKDFARVVIDQASAIRAEARSKPGVILGGLLGGRVHVRLVWEDDDPPMLTIAISQRLHPGELDVPGGWQLIVAAAFLPDADPERLSFAWDLAGRPLQPDEIAFCDFVPRA